MNKFGTAIILAGGKSSRMGFDKQFLEFKGKRLLDIIIGQVKEEFEEIIIITNKPEEYKGYPYRIKSDAIKSIGPLAGIYTGLKAAKSKYSFLIACDMPYLNMDYIGYMKEIIEEHGVEVCISEKGGYIEPFHGFYSRGIVEDLEKYIGEGKRNIRGLIRRLDSYYVEEAVAREYSPDLKIFENLNTQEDLEKASRKTSLSSQKVVNGK